MLEVLSAGFLSTIQDGGRPDHVALGVPVSGACDPLGLAVANALTGNGTGAAALEMTLSGPELAVVETCVAALGGADLGAEVPEDGRRLRPAGAYLLRAGTRLVFRGPPAGARGYLALRGGIDAAEVLGSASTYLPGGFGGLGGRALAPADRLVPRRPTDLAAAGRSWPSDPAARRLLSSASSEGASVVRLVDGPHGSRFHDGVWRALLEEEWRVGADSDRVGLRLDGPMLAAPSAELVSLGMTWGAVQVPPDGRPIVLLVDHQTVGGYHVPAVAIRADRGRLGQLRPGDLVAFERVTVAAAQHAYREQQSALRAAAAALRSADEWDELIGRAEG